MKSFVSSVMCNWQEEIDGDTVAFSVVCTESENKLVIETTGGKEPKQTLHLTLDGFRELSGWLERQVKTAI